MWFWKREGHRLFPARHVKELLRRSHMAVKKLPTDEYKQWGTGEDRMMRSEWNGI